MFAVSGTLIDHTRSPLTAGNQALRTGQAAQAVALYAQGMLGKGRPFGVYELLAANLRTARRQWLRAQQGQRPLLALLAPVNATERSAQLAQAHSAYAQVSHLELPDTAGPWFSQLAEQVAQHPLHALQLIDPDGPAIAAALLYQTIWGSRVWVDLCHTDPQAPTTDLLTHQLTDERTPRLLDAQHPAWHSLALSVAPGFDVLTVASPALQQRHGGTYLPQPSDAQATVQRLWQQPTPPALPLEAQRLANALWRQAAHGLLALRTQAETTATPAHINSANTQRVVVLVHAHYPHIWPEIADRLAHLQAAGTQPFDLIVTTPANVCADIGRRLAQQFAGAQLLPVDATSDMQALLAALPALLAKPYLAICKLHTKQGQGEPGALWRRTMLDALVGHPSGFARVAQAFAEHPGLTIAGPAELYLSAQRLMLDNRAELDRVFQQHHGHDTPAHDWGFFAGSCLWLRPQALAHLAKHTAAEHSLSQRDGTWAHALERYLGHLPHQQAKGLVGLLHRPAQAGAFALQLAAPGAHISHSTSRAWAQAAAQLPEQLQALERSAGFDAEHYLQQYPALAHTGACLPSHWLLVGRHWGLHPLRQHPAIQLAQPYRAMSAQIPWAELAKAPKVPGLTSIVIPALNHGPMTLQCLQSVVRHTEPGTYEIILVDNGSEPEHAALMADWVARHPQARLLRHPQNTQFAHGCNAGAALARGNHLVLINNDIEVTANWLPPINLMLAENNVRIAQPVIHERGTANDVTTISLSPIRGYGVEKTISRKKTLAQISRVDFATGACIAMHTTTYLSIRGFDTIYINGQEDIALCQNELAVGKIYTTAKSRVIHKKSQTQGRFNHTKRNKYLFMQKHPTINANPQQKVDKIQPREHESNFKTANILYKNRAYKEAYIAYNEITTNNKILKKQATWWAKKSWSMIDQKITTQHIKEIADCLMGPILLSYIQSLRNSIIEKNIKQINFLSREGFFLKEIYDNLMRSGLLPRIKTTYLLCSRSFLFKLLSSKQKNLPLTLGHPFNGTIEDLLRKRFLLSEMEMIKIINPIQSEIHQNIQLPRDQEKVAKIICNLSPILDEITRNETSHYLNYVNSVIGNDKEVHIADIGYSGTIQKSLSILTNKKITGHYFYTTRSAENDEKNRYIGHLSYGINFGEGFSLIDRSILQEMLLTSPTGQLQGIESTSSGYHFKFGPNGAAQNNFEMLKQIFMYAEDYLRVNIARNSTITSDILNVYYNEYTSSDRFLQNPIQNILEIDDTISGASKIVAKKVLSHA